MVRAAHTPRAHRPIAVILAAPHHLERGVGERLREAYTDFDANALTARKNVTIFRPQIS